MQDCTQNCTHQQAYWLSVNNIEDAVSSHSSNSSIYRYINYTFHLYKQVVFCLHLTISKIPTPYVDVNVNYRRSPLCVSISPLELIYNCTSSQTPICIELKLPQLYFFIRIYPTVSHFVSLGSASHSDNSMRAAWYQYAK